MSELPSGHPIIFYDGVCALCNGLVRFVLKRDRKNIFRFAWLQSDLARGTQPGGKPPQLETVYLVLEPGTPDEEVVERSDAILKLLDVLGGGWAVVGRILGVLPRRFRDLFYRVVARSRYRVFGRYDVCPLPAPKDRAKFLDIERSGLG